MEALFAGGFDASLGQPLPKPNDPEKDYYWYVVVGGMAEGVHYRTGALLLWYGANKAYSIIQPLTFGDIRGKTEQSTQWASWEQVQNKPETLVKYDENKDITARIYHATHPTQSVIPKGSAMAYRIDSKTNTGIRFADADAIKEFLGTVKDSELLQGETLESIKTSIRNNLVPNTLKINGYPLNSHLDLSAADFGLQNVANYGNTSSPTGSSTTLYATQRCAYEASAAPRLADERKRIIDISEQAPVPNAPDGIYIKLDKSARTFTMQVKSEGILYTQA